MTFQAAHMTVPTPSRLLGLDWKAASKMHIQRFYEAMGREDEEAANEALTSALVAERMTDIQIAVASEVPA